ncbi:MAG: S-layer homology domain-containing protein [Clostridia bacterium]|jgi:hypothetical protein|nr:S-layer homology domain-containing protein [Clostridia bacterium]
MRKILSLLVLMALTFSFSYAEEDMEIVYLDEIDGQEVYDIDDHWAEETIRTYMLNGYINGFEDGTFRPNDTITKEQFAKIVVDYLALEGKEYSFSDVSSDRWSKSFVGVFGGYIGEKSGTFNPTKELTREDVIVYLVKIKEKLGDKYYKFTIDIDIRDEFVDGDKIIDADRILKGVHNKLVEGYEDGTLKPDKKVTRAEFLTILDRLR